MNLNNLSEKLDMINTKLGVDTQNYSEDGFCYDHDRIVKTPQEYLKKINCIESFDTEYSESTDENDKLILETGNPDNPDSIYKYEYKLVDQEQDHTSYYLNDDEINKLVYPESDLVFKNPTTNEEYKSFVEKLF